MIMADGGYVRLPDGSVVVALALPRPGAPGRVRVLVHARNRARALTRLRNLGLRSVYLRGNAAPPQPDEITAVLHHPEGLLWRSTPLCATEPWHPMTRLLSPARRPAARPRAPRHRPVTWAVAAPAPHPAGPAPHPAAPAAGPGPHPAGPGHPPGPGTAPHRPDGTHA